MEELRQKLLDVALLGTLDPFPVVSSGISRSKRFRNSLENPRSGITNQLTLFS